MNAFSQEITSLCQDYTTKAMTTFINIQMPLGYNTVQSITITDLLTTAYAIMPALIHLSNNIQHWQSRKNS